MPRNTHFELFQDHTRLKHFLLALYLKQWATIHISGRRKAGADPPKSLWFVDAFAGAGQDEHGTPGSPLIAAEIASEINRTEYPHHGKTTGMHVLAIEAHDGRHQQLKEALKPYSSVAEVRSGTLRDLIGKLMPFLQKHNAPALFFLDPFGINGLDASLLPQILGVDKTEILLLFSDEGAVRLAGKAEAKVPTRDELLAARRDGRLSLGEKFDAEQEERDRLDVEKIIAGHASNPRAAEILDVTLGGKDWRRIVETTPAPERRQAFVTLYREVLMDAGAEHVLPFAVTTGEGRHKYTLMHASTHVSAFAAMKEAMHRAHRQRRPAEQSQDLFGNLGIDVPAEGRDRTFSSGADVREVAAQVHAAFQGKRVPWREGPVDETVYGYALRHTPLLIHEFPLLEAELQRLNYLERKRPRTYKFP
jgi:three-Cys-motif partner protein